MTSPDPNSLEADFDCVVFLTWSNWRTEPRSNRYHYASRFAKYLPVIFVQPDLLGTRKVLEETEIEGLDILHVYKYYGPKQNDLINDALLERGFMKPMLWIFNPNFIDFIQRRFSPLKVFHATEAYFAPEYGLSEDFIELLRENLRHIDLLVAVSEAVLDSYERDGTYEGEKILLPNGCDYSFWGLKDEEILRIADSKKDRNIAFYQGGINNRIDWALLRELVESMPDWDFWLCGLLDKKYKGALRSLHQENVKHLGYLEPERIRAYALKATVGIIPFIQNSLIKASLPLKAFEYVASGLPVVSVPIIALDSFGDLFEIVNTHQEFAAALRKVAKSRFDVDTINKRLATAKKQDYSVRFLELIDKIESLIQEP
ncbi:MAG: glycosyltransferase [Chloroflexi bacterium]|nr:MAG: glycosyltransferase [Chloroflexota bacterium]MBL1193124.1 glycosyltransferase [Chloroflexota bacterium]NOH10417.1 glycosyltransferase [Chloroflexota bacterium]